ncbi:MAG: DUF3343 domain-containing protein [Bacteroidales bacterium]|nr:DUF3343 domain-containing protein [Bacteroidales bacterium]HOY38112.1 DUF3343 domain-containing protein [Bacteroidales bacterium]
MHEKYYILFRSTRDVILAEKLAKSQFFQFTIVPVPKHISAECGLCINADVRTAIQLYEFLSEHGLKCEKLEM